MLRVARNFISKPHTRATILGRPFASLTPQLSQNDEIQKVSKVLYVQQLEDWYEVPRSYLRLVGPEGNALFKLYPSTEAFVRAAYPEHSWDHTKFATPGVEKHFTPQLFLRRVVRALFPENKIETNVRQLGLVGFSGAALEIDVYLPELSLGFEYQDQHHYFVSRYGAYTLTEFQARDAFKHQQATEKGITIVDIPFWWNWDEESLIASIKQQRPYLLPTRHAVASPIVLEPPESIRDKYLYEIPGLGVPMLALNAPQAQAFNPVNWWIFEKYDGIRAIWSADERQFYSRYGRHLHLPNYISDVMPNSAWLDGELWFGRKRGTRYQAIKISSKAAHHLVSWGDVTYMVFDKPLPQTIPYEQRYHELCSIISLENPFVSLTPYQICTSRDAIESIFFNIRAQDGEGIVLRDPGSPYVNGYTRFLYKHKGFKDAEALVLRKLPGGRFICRVNKFNMLHNEEKDAGTQQQEGERGEGRGERDIGSIERDTGIDTGEDAGRDTGMDMGRDTKRDMKREERENIEGENKEVGTPGRKTAETEKKRGKKREKKLGAQKTEADEAGEAEDDSEFFEMEMKVDEKLFDGDIGEISAGTFVAFRYTGEYTGGVGPPLYPRIYSIRNDVTSWDQILQNKQRAPAHQRVWKPVLESVDLTDINNQRTFFNSLARELNFDPLAPENWYKFDRSSVPKAGYAILRYYNDSLITALMTVYPSIGLQPHKFKFVPSAFWTKQENRKLFFDEFAQKNGFDPLVASNWYNFIKEDLFQEKGGHGVMKHYDGSISKALLDIYPFIGLETRKFKFLQTKFWMDKGNRRNFFDEFAASRNFDPLIAEKWSSVSYSDIIDVKGGCSILRLYDDSLLKCLQDLYPSIEFDRDNFKYPTRYWEDKENQKKFLDEYATKRGFDPLVASNWYSVTQVDIAETKRGSSLLHNYGESLVRTLEAVYGHKLDPMNYPSVPSKFWKDKANRKRFFDLVASRLGFSYKNAKEWYYLSSKDILKFRGGVTILDKYYEGSYRKALMDIYPDIGLDPNLLRGTKKEQQAKQ